MDGLAADGRGSWGGDRVPWHIRPPSGGGRMISATTLVRFSGSTPCPAADDVAITRLRLFGTSVWMTYRRNDAEWARRAEFGLGAVLAWDLLDLLMTLPVGFPVPLRSLSRPHQR